MSTFGPLPDAPAQSLLTIQEAKPLHKQIADSQRRLRGAYGDATLTSVLPCDAKPEQTTQYAGKCRQCHDNHIDATHALASTEESREEAKLLFEAVMQDGVGGKPASLLQKKGNMFGVLICVDAEGKTHVLKAFSGGYSDTKMYDVPGWCPVVPSHDPERQAELDNAFDEAEAKAKDFGVARKSVAGLTGKLAKLNKDEAQAAKVPELRRTKAMKDDAEWEKLKTKDTADREAKTKERQELRKSLDAELVIARAAYNLKYSAISDADAPAHEKTLTTERDIASAAAQAHYADQRFVQPYQGTARPFRSACICTDTSGNLDAAKTDKMSIHGKTGWCAAPKLLACAKAQGFTPVSMTEFWMGDAINFQESHMISSCDNCKSFIGLALCGLEQQQRALATSDKLNPEPPAQHKGKG